MRSYFSTVVEIDFSQTQGMFVYVKRSRWFKLTVEPLNSHFQLDIYLFVDSASETLIVTIPTLCYRKKYAPTSILGSINFSCLQALSWNNIEFLNWNLTTIQVIICKKRSNLIETSVRADESEMFNYSGWKWREHFSLRTMRLHCETKFSLKIKIKKQLWQGIPEGKDRQNIAAVLIMQLVVKKTC